MGIRTFKAAVFPKIRMKSDCFGERIATPVCAPARNDSFFDSLKRANRARFWYLTQMPQGSAPRSATCRASCASVMPEK